MNWDGGSIASWNLTFVASWQVSKQSLVSGAMVTSQNTLWCHTSAHGVKKESISNFILHFWQFRVEALVVGGYRSIVFWWTSWCRPVTCSWRTLSGTLLSTCDSGENPLCSPTRNSGTMMSLLHHSCLATMHCMFYSWNVHKGKPPVLTYKELRYMYHDIIITS